MIIKPDTPKTFKERFKKWIAKSIWDFLRSSGATNFPGSLDSYSTKSSGDTISEAHINDPQDAIEAIEAKIGTGASTPTDAKVFVGTGAGTSAWEATGTTVAASGANTDITSLGGITNADGSLNIYSISTYEGDGNDNRNVAHGLGRTPKLVLITTDPADQEQGVEMYAEGFTAGWSKEITTSSGQQDGIQSVDSTNVQVGTSVNVNRANKTFVMFVM